MVNGEIERVDIGYVAQLAARDVADTGSLHLDHLGPEPRQKLRAGRAGLHVREIQNTNTV
jgi:hypothetical protein